MSYLFARFPSFQRLPTYRNGSLFANFGFQLAHRGRVRNGDLVHIIIEVNPKNYVMRRYVQIVERTAEVVAAARP